MPPTSDLSVHEAPDCGNAPRKAVMRDLAIAIARADAPAAAAPLRSDVSLTLAGDRTLEGIDAVRAWVDGLDRATTLTFRSVLTHGRQASMTGTVERAGTAEHFSYVVTFAGAAKTALIVAIESYLIPV